MAKEMPHSIEAEQSILGAMLVYPSLVRTVVDQDLHAEEFYVEAHQRIFGCMMDLHENGQNVDVTTLITRLNDTSQLALVGGAGLCDQAERQCSIQCQRRLLHRHHQTALSSAPSDRNG